MNTARERNEQINFVVTEDQKARWNKHLDSNGDEFQSLSHLIRRAVEKEVSNQSNDDEHPTVPRQDNSEILEAISRVDEKVRDLDARITIIERAVRSDSPRTRKGRENTTEGVDRSTVLLSEITYYRRKIGESTFVQIYNLPARDQSEAYGSLEYRIRFE